MEIIVTWWFIVTCFAVVGVVAALAYVVGHAFGHVAGRLAQLDDNIAGAEAAIEARFAEDRQC